MICSDVFITIGGYLLSTHASASVVFTGSHRYDEWRSSRGVVGLSGSHGFELLCAVLCAVLLAVALRGY
jgi:hypothetical protein